MTTGAQAATMDDMTLQTFCGERLNEDQVGDLQNLLTREGKLIETTQKLKFPKIWTMLVKRGVIEQGKSYWKFLMPIGSLGLYGLKREMETKVTDLFPEARIEPSVADDDIPIATENDLKLQGYCSTKLTRDNLASLMAWLINTGNIDTDEPGTLSLREMWCELLDNGKITPEREGYEVIVLALEAIKCIAVSRGLKEQIAQLF